jgi:hypothetical protein
MRIEMIFSRLDHPISKFHVLFFSYYDVGAAESAVNDLLGVQKSQALNDGQEGIYDFLF